VIDPTGGAATTGQNDASTVWDGGAARTVQSVRVGLVGLTGAATLIAAAAGLKTKVLGIHFLAAPPTTAGAFYLKDATSGGILLMMDQIPVTIYTTRTITMSGYVMCQTTVNSILQAQFDGTVGTFNVQVQYYQAP
jgi:hypothetical protein